MKEVNLIEGYLVDSDGIKFKRPCSVKTIEVKVSIADIRPPIIHIQKDFIDTVKNSPEINAFRNCGIISGKWKIEPEDYNESRKPFITYNFYKIELYHLGK